MISTYNELLEKVNELGKKVNELENKRSYRHNITYEIKTGATTDSLLASLNNGTISTEYYFNTGLKVKNYIIYFSVYTDSPNEISHYDNMPQCNPNALVRIILEDNTDIYFNVTLQNNTDDEEFNYYQIPKALGWADNTIYLLYGLDLDGLDQDNIEITDYVL